MAEKNSFVLYTDYLKHVKKLDIEQRGELFTAILCYTAGEPIPELDAVTDMIFGVIQEQIDKDTALYMEKVQKRAEAGKLGGRPKANDFSENQEKAKKANDFSEKQEKAKKANGFSEKQNNPDNEYVNENVNVNENVINKKRLAPDDESPCAGKFLLNDSTEYAVSENDVVTYQQLYPGIDVRQELRNIEAWCLSNPRQRKTRTGARRFLNGWLARSQNSFRPENSLKPEKITERKKNTFNNFDQRQYDYDDLERQLLRAGLGG